MKKEVNEKKATVNEKGQVLVPVPLRVNKESIVDGKVGDKPVVYRRIGGGKFPCIIGMVTEEEYQIYMQFEQAQVKQEIREKRCRIYDEETKGYIMCPECNKCINCRKHADWKFNNMHEVSLESFVDEEDDNSEGLPIKGREVNEGEDMMTEQIVEMIEAEDKTVMDCRQRQSTQLHSKARRDAYHSSSLVCKQVLSWKLVVC